MKYETTDGRVFSSGEAAGKHEAELVRLQEMADRNRGIIESGGLKKLCNQGARRSADRLRI